MFIASKYEEIYAPEPTYAAAQNIESDIQSYQHKAFPESGGMLYQRESGTHKMESSQYNHSMQPRQNKFVSQYQDN